MCRAKSVSLTLIAVGTLAVAPAAAQEAGVTVDAVLTTGVVERMPVDTASSFPADVGAVFLWTRVEGAAGTTLRHAWMHGGQEAVVELSIEGSPWRTWSTRRVLPEWTGEWRVEIRDEADNVLETVTFTVG